jgi:hypothetical protein
LDARKKILINGTYFPGPPISLNRFPGACCWGLKASINEWLDAAIPVRYSGDRGF